MVSQLLPLANNSDFPLLFKKKAVKGLNGRAGDSVVPCCQGGLGVWATLCCGSDAGAVSVLVPALVMGRWRPTVLRLLLPPPPSTGEVSGSSLRTVETIPPTSPSPGKSFSRPHHPEVGCAFIPEAGILAEGRTGCEARQTPCPLSPSGGGAGSPATGLPWEVGISQQTFQSVAKRRGNER